MGLPGDRLKGASALVIRKPIITNACVAGSMMTNALFLIRKAIVVHRMGVCQLQDENLPREDHCHRRRDVRDSEQPCADEYGGDGLLALTFKMADDRGTCESVRRYDRRVRKRKAQQRCDDQKVDVPGEKGKQKPWSPTIVFLNRPGEVGNVTSPDVEDEHRSQEGAPCRQAG